MEKERNPTPEVMEKERLRKRKRAIREMGEDVGKEAQDMRIPTERNINTKKVSSFSQHLGKVIANGVV